MICEDMWQEQHAGTDGDCTCSTDYASYWLLLQYSCDPAEDNAVSTQVMLASPMSCMHAKQHQGTHISCST